MFVQPKSIENKYVANLLLNHFFDSFVECALGIFGVYTTVQHSAINWMSYLSELKMVYDMTPFSQHDRSRQTKYTYFNTNLGHISHSVMFTLSALFFLPRFFCLNIIFHFGRASVWISRASNLFKSDAR